MKGLYDNKSASQLYEEEYEPGHEGMNSNNFVVTRELLRRITQRRSPSSWRFGSAAWTSGPPTRTRSSRPTQTTSGTPTRRSSTTSRTGTRHQFDEFVDSVYLDEEWINGEAQVTDLLIERPGWSARISRSRSTCASTRSPARRPAAIPS